MVVIIASNFFTLAVSSPEKLPWNGKKAAKEVSLAEDEMLYLLDKAAVFIPDTWTFSQKVGEIARSLEVLAEWLMAVMYTESRFNPRAQNLKGSGAVGLIQWMPETAKEMGISSEDILMPAETCNWSMFAYLQRVKNKYGEFDSLTDFLFGWCYTPRQLVRLLFFVFLQTGPCL
ncbi:MAG: lytic transglycosylase domain-containing protein [Bacteroidia bacterium]